MPEIGQTISHYRITEKLGQGGMGEVFLAHDTSLDRKVALKFLPDIFSGDPERLARFEREARLLASLNHPNIATIYGLEKADGKRFLAMELIQGETLGQQIDRGPLPVDKAIEICRQIAEGLEAAHEKGITHRDLKPANIKIAPEGKVKILDFGLAKAYACEDAPGTIVDASRSPTLTQVGTAAGVILGTAAYMAPEQARGGTVDKRADIWAFGVVLFEMLTGKCLFAGDTVSDTLASVLKSEPEWNLLPPKAPLRLRDLLRHCLQRDPRRRLRDMGDAIYELSMSEESRPVAAAGSPAWMGRILVAALVILTLGLAATLYWIFAHRTKAGETTYAAVTLPDGHALYSSPAISQDGKVVAFVSGGPSQQPLLRYRRILEDFEIQTIPGTEDALYPFFSHDGLSIAFFAKGQLFQVSLKGGVPVPIAQAPNPNGGGTWGDDNSIVFVPVYNAGLMRVAATGGKPELLIRPDGRTDYAYVCPTFLPGAGELMFTIWGKNAGVECLTLSSLQRRRLLNLLGTNVAYAASGHILYGTDLNMFKSEVLAASSSPAKGKTKAMTARVLSGVFAETRWGRFWYDLSRNGTLVYAAGDVSRNSLVLTDRTGRVLSTYGGRGSYETPAISPEGDRVAFARDCRIYVLNLKRGEETLLSTEAGAVVIHNDRTPTWTPNGTRVIFSSNRSGNWDIYAKDASAAGEAEPLIEKPSNQGSPSMGRLGTLVFVDTNPDTATDIWIRRPDGKLEPWLVTPNQEIMATLSPDEKLIAYASDVSQRFEVYVNLFAPRSRRFRISTEGGICPTWSPKGDRLFFRQGTNIMSVGIRPDGSPDGKPEKLFDGGWELGTGGGQPAIATNVTVNGFAVMPDGEHFLMIRSEPETVPTKINVIFNWFEELKRLVPSGNE